jgi:hypothetical protein
MILVRTSPHIEGVPEIFGLYCVCCKDVEARFRSYRGGDRGPPNCRASDIWFNDLTTPVIRALSKRGLRRLSRARSILALI